MISLVYIIKVRHCCAGFHFIQLKKEYLFYEKRNPW